MWLKSSWDEFTQFIDTRENKKSIEKKYLIFIKKYLEKKYNEWVDQWLVDLIEANWDKIDFLDYLDYILKINPDDLGLDDIYQIANLKNEIREIREEVEDLWPRDFQIIDWNIWSYTFKWKDTFKYLWKNFYAVKIDFDKINNISKQWWWSITLNYTKWDIFFINYDWKNIIKYYVWKNFNEKRFVGHKVIDHKFEKIKRKEYKNWKKQIIEYRRWAEEKIYLEKLEMNLTIKFFEKKLRY